MGNAQLVAAAVQDEQHLRKKAFEKENSFRKILRDSSNPFLLEAEQFRKYYR